ncbi:MAG: nucleotidyltransferase family protein [Bacteroidales bacterium]|nr:nucleotidyltransferase family protein [Bacteroidales bacterium]
MTILLSLARKAISGDPLPEDVVQSLSRLSEEGWQELYREARRQSVTGLLYHALSDMPEDCPAAMPDSVSFPLVVEVSRLENKSRNMAALSSELVALFRQSGLHPVEMKGAVIAAMYPAPGLREYGDIDLFFPDGEAAEAVCILESKGATVSRSPDGSLHFDCKGIDVDIHERYFDLPGKAGKPEPGTAEAVLLMLSAHLLKHAAGAGAGLRQVCDLAAAYSCLDGKYDPEALRTYCARNGIGAWNKLASSFLSRYLGVPDKLYPSNNASAAPLLRIISEGGNFGHHSESRSQAINSSPFRRKADTAFRYLKHLPFSLRYAAPVALSSIVTLVKGNLRK